MHDFEDSTITFEITIRANKMAEVAAEYGIEGAEEYVQHIMERINAKFMELGDLINDIDMQVEHDKTFHRLMKDKDK